MDLINREEMKNHPYRGQMVEDVTRYLCEEMKKAKERRHIFTQNTPQEERREALKRQLGFPLSPSPEKNPLRAKQEKLYENEIFTAYRMQIEVIRDVWLYGILCEPKEKKEKYPLVIMQHGGLGTPEMIMNLISPTNYGSLGMDCVKKGVYVFAPQLFHWSQADWGSPYQGDYIDTNFRQLGGSKTAFHIYAITRAIDYLLETGKIDPNRIGMAGLSYGGMYTLVTAAVEPRIKVAVSSCYINDRAKYAWNDWSYPGQANTFFDAELFTLIAPRHIFAEAGKNDPVFSVDGVQEVIDEVAYYTAKMGLPEDFYHIRLFDGNHQFFCDGESLSYLFKYL